MADRVQTELEGQRFLDFPYDIAGDGAARTTAWDDHLRDLVLQVLFTRPGERVNLPEFGVGVQQLVFAPNDETLRTSAQFLITTSLQRWLGDRIDVDQVSVTGGAGEEGAVVVEIVYTLKSTQARQRLQVEV